MAKKSSVDVSKFEMVCKWIVDHKEEDSADWKLAKKFEHTTVYRKTDNDSIFKVIVTYIMGDRI